MDEKAASLLKKFSEAGSLAWAEVREISSQTGVQERSLEDQALSQGIIPLRYHRNIGTISVSEQQVLLNSKVVVIGCGGLGGNVLEQLARLGIGTIIGWDFDAFEEHNINRQILSDFSLLGKGKVEAAESRLKAINPAVCFQAVKSRFDMEQARTVLPGCKTVIDALDNARDRLKLSSACRELGIPLVHGAVEGWMGQLTTQFPGDTVIEEIYRQNYENGRILSTPAFTPALVASLQVAETVKILLGRGELLRNRIMLINLLDMDMETIELCTDD